MRFRGIARISRHRRRRLVRSALRRGARPGRVPHAAPGSHRPRM